MSVYIPTIGTILVAVVTAIFGIFSYKQQKREDSKNYVEQKRIDREVDLRKQRIEDYERYITAYQKDTSLYDFDPRPTETSEAKLQARSEYWVAYSNLFQIASDPVLRAASDFHKFWWEYDSTDEEQNEEIASLYAKMIMAMREDVSEKTNMTLEDIEGRVPFVFTPSQSINGEAARGEQTE